MVRDGAAVGAGRGNRTLLAQETGRHAHRCSGTWREANGSSIDGGEGGGGCSRGAPGILAARGSLRVICNDNISRRLSSAVLAPGSNLQSRLINAASRLPEQDMQRST